MSTKLYRSSGNETRETPLVSPEYSPLRTSMFLSVLLFSSCSSDCKSLYTCIDIAAFSLQTFTINPFSAKVCFDQGPHRRWRYNDHRHTWQSPRRPVTYVFILLMVAWPYTAEYIIHTHTWLLPSSRITYKFLHLCFLF